MRLRIGWGKPLDMMPAERADYPAERTLFFSDRRGAVGIPLWALWTSAALLALFGGVVLVVGAF